MPMTDALALEVAVQRFVADCTPTLEAILADLPGRDPGDARGDVVNEAYNLVCAGIDADGLATDPELWALLKIFGPLLDSPLLATTPSAIREARTMRGKAQWFDEPSPLFEILAGLDAKDGGRRAADYYDAALRVAYLVVALDGHPGRRELLTIERWRATLLRRLDDLGVARPVSGAPSAPGGRPVAPPGPDAAAADGPTGATPPGAGSGAHTAAGKASDATAVEADQDAGAADDRPPPRPLEELLAELDQLVGMDEVKEEVRLVAALLEVQNLRAERGLPTLDTSRHLVFTGNPGTGKTTVARLLAEIYRTLGVVESGHLVETDRSGLVAGFVGQTATKVTEVFDRADQGVLIIDEAYSLVRGSEQDFGREAIDTIVKLVEDRRDRVVVIIAGYPDEMAQLVGANPGLRSRFPRTIEFPDYTSEELVRIFDLICESGHYRSDEATDAAVVAWLEAQPRTKGFGNGRLVRNLFESAAARQARRVVAIEDPSDDDLVTLLPEDLPPLPGMAEVVAEVTSARPATPDRPTADEPDEPGGTDGPGEPGEPEGPDGPSSDHGHDADGPE